MKLRRPRLGRRAKLVGGTVAAVAGLTVLAGIVAPPKTGWVGQLPSGHAEPSTASSAGAGMPPAVMLNPAVTQESIRTTVCVPGWTATVRPPASYTTALKRAQLVAAHAPDQTLTSYEEDHWIPLELGGAPRAAENLWPELWADARLKDQQENALHRQVCDGTLTLHSAQLTMFLDWGPQLPFLNARPK